MPALPLNIGAAASFYRGVVDCKSVCWRLGENARNSLTDSRQRQKLLRVTELISIAAPPLGAGRRSPPHRPSVIVLMDTSRSHDSYAATMEEALQPAAVSSIEDMEFDRLINGARKSSRFTKQLHVCGMYQDTSMEAMTRAKTKERVERQRRERTIQRINSNFDVNFNYIKR